MYLRAEVSMPDVGSSRMITLEPPVKASATDNLRFCPPERFLAYSPLLERRFTSAISFSTSCYRASSSRPLKAPKSRRCSSTVRSS